MPPLVRIEEAGLGRDAQVRLVVTGVSAPERLRTTWASSGASVQMRVAGRLHATTTPVALTRAAGRCLPEEEAQALDRSVRAAIDAWLGPAPPLELPEGGLDFSTRPLVMGVVNVTPDSFSDGGRLYPDGHPAAAVAHARGLVAEGADVLDVGGESTRPGAQPVPAEEEMRRVGPVLDALADSRAVRSIDTAKADVAREAIKAGALIVNDVSGARDPELLDAVAEAGAGYVLMHSRGTPADMQSQARYGNVVAEVYEFLAVGLDRCQAAGIAGNRIMVDPGLGFAKTAEHNVELLGAVRQFRSLGRPVVVGASRKSFLGVLLGGADASERLEGGLACAALAVASGVAMIRVHDVAPTVKAVAVARAVAGRAAGWS